MAATVEALNNRNDVQKWIALKISEYASIPIEDVDPDVPIEEFGIDSAGAVTLGFDIEEALGLDYQIEPEVLFEHNTASTLTGFIFERTGKA